MIKRIYHVVSFHATPEGGPCPVTNNAFFVSMERLAAEASVISRVAGIRFAADEGIAESRTLFSYVRDSTLSSATPT